MLIRRQTLLLFFLCGWLPAVALACAVFGYSVHERRIELEDRTRDEARQTAGRLHSALVARERQVELLAADSGLVDFPNVREGTPNPTTARVPSMSGVFLDSFANIYKLNGHDLRAVYCFDSNRQPVFIAEFVAGPEGGYVIKPTRSIPQATLDETVWATVAKGGPFGVIVRDGIERHFVPLKVPRTCALLVADLNIESLIQESLAPDQTAGQDEFRLVLDQQGRLLNELPGAVRYQPASSIFAELSRIAPDFKTERPNSAVMFDRGIRYFLASQPVGSFGLSVVVMHRQESVTGKPFWLFLGILIAITILFLVFARWHQTGVRRDRLALSDLERSAAEIAEGRLTTPVPIDGSPAFQKLSANFNLMTERLHEQIAREAEARQFQSFMRLSATIVHDVKNAVQALSLLVGNIEEHFDNPDFRAHAILGLTRSTEKLNQLIARLSEPVRSMSGELPLPQPIDLAVMLRQVLRATVEQDRTNHRLEVDLPERLIVSVDAERIEKVFENLVINAMQAMQNQAGTLTVRGAADADNCTITITDTGVGMSEDYLREKLFRPFTTTKPLGIGLGLYTCREVVRAHGGTIEAESKKGSGTTFRVVLPLRAKALWTT